jgi:hypothetical protein
VENFIIIIDLYDITVKVTCLEKLLIIPDNWKYIPGYSTTVENYELYSFCSFRTVNLFSALLSTLPLED